MQVLAEPKERRCALSTDTAKAFAPGTGCCRMLEEVWPPMKWKNMTRMVCGLMVLLSVSPVPVFAQSPSGHSSGPASSISELQTKVKRGDTIYVLDTDARESKGTLTEVSESSIRLLVKGQIREIPAGDVQRVARRGDKLWNGALIGAAVGGILAASSTGDPYCAELDRLYGNGTCVKTSDGTLGVLAGAVVFGAIGAGIDALIPGRTVVYRATPQRTVRLAPVLSGHQVGARLSLAF
jgi:hypothetical protein